MNKLITSVEKTYKTGVEIMKKKNADYATGDDPFHNFRFATLLGMSVEEAILLRVLDKLARVANLLKKDPKVVEEKMEDTIIDICNYMAILKAYRELLTEEEQ